MSCGVFCFMSLVSSVIGISDTVVDISLLTGSSHGGDGSFLSLTLTWNDTLFACAVEPNSTDSVYSCDNVSSSGASYVSDVTYSLKMEWSSSAPVEVASITVSDASGSFYHIASFCVGPTMQCTLDTALGVTAGALCSSYRSKNSYTSIALGGESKFSLLYIDIGIFGSRFDDQSIEGSVRPPSLSSVGFVTAAGYVIAYISVQWDTVLYTCTDALSPVTDDTLYSCVPSVSSVCPGIQSEFWMSLYNPDDIANILTLQAIQIQDETGNIYSLDNFCQPHWQYIGTTECSVPISGYAKVNDVMVGGFARHLIPFLIPDCMFQYPNDDSHNLQTETLLGLYESGSSNHVFGWDVGQYGGPIDPQCPLTPQPSSDPTAEPTVFDGTYPPTAFTAAPTQQTTSPSQDPTQDPTHDPTYQPSLNPTTEPTAHPSVHPSVSPTLHPSTTPSTSPSKFPSLSPSLLPTVSPSRVPSDSPSVEPTQEPTMEPTVSPSHLPTKAPTTEEPTQQPTSSPTVLPTTKPTLSPSKVPSKAPSAETGTKEEEASESGSQIANAYIVIIAVMAVVILCLIAFILARSRQRREGNESDLSDSQAQQHRGQVSGSGRRGSAVSHVSQPGLLKYRTDSKVLAVEQPEGVDEQNQTGGEPEGIDEPGDVSSDDDDQNIVEFISATPGKNNETLGLHAEGKHEEQDVIEAVNRTMQAADASIEMHKIDTRDYI